MTFIVTGNHTATGRSYAGTFDGWAQASQIMRAMRKQQWVEVRLIKIGAAA